MAGGDIPFLPGSLRGSGAQTATKKKEAASRFSEFLTLPMAEDNVAPGRGKAKIIPASEQKNPLNIGSETVLKLLIAQLTHQNPFDPTDSTAFVDQMAMFSNIQQSTEMNANLKKLLEYSALNEKVSAAQFVGKTIEAQGQWFEAGGEELFELSFDAPERLTGATVRIFDRAGNVVRECAAVAEPVFDDEHNVVGVEPRIPAPGRHKITFSWLPEGKPYMPGVFDRRNNDGEIVEPGIYRFVVVGTTQQGEEVSHLLPTHVRSKVTEMVQENGRMLALLGNIPVVVNKIESFSESIFVPAPQAPALVDQGTDAGTETVEPTAPVSPKEEEDPGETTSEPQPPAAGEEEEVATGDSEAEPEVPQIPAPEAPPPGDGA
ncbi:MAG: hypothetical protein LBQ26_00715 [Holosporales bacterium]|jgi:flagellar basal-body rod modification protein FlgD|nr:hypothetical protein [Holosporales bacterium]